jgi:PKD repeat protein
MRAGVIAAISISLLAAIFISPVSADWMNVTSEYTSGYIHKYQAAGWTWDIAHDATSGTASTMGFSPMVYVSATSSSNKYNIGRGILVFNTNTLPLDANIASVELCLYVDNTHLYESWPESYLEIVYAWPDNPLALVAGDYDNFGTHVYAQIPLGGADDDAKWYNVTFEDDGIIKKNGFTVIGFRIHEDTSDTAPSWVNGYKNQFDIAVGAGLDPHLNIEYTDYSPVADFSANVTTASSAPLEVLFTDTSANTPTSWSWSFGDGGSSTDQNPVHAYNALGYYTVSLSATNAGGSDTETKKDYIKIGPAPDDISVNILEKYSGAALINQAITVTPISGGSGETKTSLYGETLHINVVTGESYWFNASRPGYSDYNETYTIPASPGIYNVYMERTLTPIEGKSYAHFSVVDQTNGGLIPNAEIRLSDGQTKLTNSAGYTWFSVNNSEQINYYVSKSSGYWPAYGAFNITEDESILVALQRYTGPTATATMPGWTPVTVPTTGTGVDPVVTLSAQLRQQNVQEGMDVWYTNLPFISQFLFLLFIIGGLGLMAGGTRRN